MLHFKERYQRYSLIAILIILVGIIFSGLTSFLGGILGAMTIYILLRKQLNYLTHKRGMKKALAAALLVGETIVLFLLPLGLFVNVVIELLSTHDFNPQSLMEPIHDLSNIVREISGYDQITKYYTIFFPTDIIFLPTIDQFVVLVDMGVSIVVFFRTIFFLCVIIFSIELCETHSCSRHVSVYNCPVEIDSLCFLYKIFC